MTDVLVLEVTGKSWVFEQLEREAFAVFTATDRDEALQSVAKLRPGIVIVEAQTPDTKVMRTCSMIRALTSAPLVLLTAPCSERATILAFAEGVDSVLSTPIGPHEFIARVRALLRRNPSTGEELDHIIEVGPVRLDRNRRELSVDGVLIAVPRREFDIAEVLMREADRVVPRAAIVRELWGSMHDTKSLDVQVGRLRTRLAAVEGFRRIVTVRGVGYKFVDDAIVLDEEVEPVTLDLLAAEIDAVLDEAPA